MSELTKPTTPSGATPIITRLTSAGGLGGPLIMLAVLVVAVAILSQGSFVSGNNIVNVLKQFSVPLILALGQTLVIITGGIDVSVAATAALSACLSGILYTQVGVPDWLAVLGGIATGAVVGLFNGFVITRWGVPDFVATLGTLTAGRGLALLLTDGYPIPNFSVAIPGRSMPDVLQSLGGGSIGPIPNIFIVAVVLVVIAGFVLNRTVLGRKLIAVGGNRDAARVAGINVGRTKMFAYLFAGIFASVGGMLMAGRLDSANGLMAPGMELTTIAAVVLGGTALIGGEGRIGGTVIGLFILATLSNGLNILGVSSFWQDFTTGLVVIGVVALDQFRRRLGARQGSVRSRGDRTEVDQAAASQKVAAG
ncbi:ABC transporter permease [Herbiconiux sp. UC225_62]|uniref:ABC transporter permease n=1 Tax=Herbiconiux sp. UC225_62 TaxID=3350168 RepID=UPI0036D3A5D8